jgi:hypothetical protein
MIAVFPAGGTLAAVLAVWMGTTASAGRHTRPGKLARLWRRLFPPQPDIRDEEGRPVRWPASSRIGESREDFWRRIGEAAVKRYMAAVDAVTPEDWAAAMLRARYPHLFSATWIEDMWTDHHAWVASMRQEIAATKREAGITE